jgi:hypothetical protein
VIDRSPDAVRRRRSRRARGHRVSHPTEQSDEQAGIQAIQRASARAAATVYGFDTTITSATPTGNPLQNDSVVGSVTTDGTLGVLGPANILDWNLELIDHLDPTQNFTLTKADSYLVSASGTALTASATGLSFDYGGYGEFLIQVSPYSGAQYFCLSTGVYACAAGETISPGDVFQDGVELVGNDAPVGVQPLSPVPEPAAVSLFLAGVTGLAFMRRRQGR